MLYQLSYASAAQTDGEYQKGIPIARALPAASSQTSPLIFGSSIVHPWLPLISTPNLKKMRKSLASSA
jgi:hypothetical protein